MILWYFIYKYSMNGNEHGDKKNICLVNKTEVLTNSPSVVTAPGGTNTVSTAHWTMKDAQGRVGDPLRTQLKKVYGDLLNVLKHLDTTIK